MFPFIKSKPPQLDPIAAEKLRQAKWAFNTAIGVVTTSTSISLIGATLIAIGKIPPNNTAALVAIASNLASTGFFQVAQDTRKRLDDKDE